MRRRVSRWVRTGAAGLLSVLIMVLGSIGLWLGTPLLWLWVGSQVQGATDSLSAAVAVMFAGVLIWVGLVAWVLATLSGIHRDHVIARAGVDPGHLMLERVLVISAAIVLVAFSVWFFLFAGASPIPIGLNF